MSIDWYFYAETRSADGWVLLAEYASQGQFPPGESFAWMKNRANASRIFFGDDALFPFASGRPPGPSELCQRLDDWWIVPGSPWEHEMKVRWIGFDELLVELWGEPALLVWASVPADLAELFGRGDGAFPSQSLRAAGASEDMLRGLRQTAALTAAAVDRTYGAGRHDLAGRPSEEAVAVTWQAPIDWLLPDADGFRTVRKLAGDAELRVVALLG